MTEKPAPATQVGDLRALLEVVLDAITLPFDARDYDRRILDRASWARSTVKGALEEDPADLGWNVGYLRGQLEAEQARADEKAKNACKRCHRPFDPNDARFDGHARHRETPFCRRCTDNCHNGGAEHVCLVCEPLRYGGATS
ncbi:hypothetical protein [Streptomyces sp. NPDC006333]|uniref:hypothetical protein n=1 Tax=Streptomyces sp. NPDC006333 TaxID=3156753 RepID=UPI0033B0F250